MAIPPLNPAPMTVEEFFAFTDTRPDNEKWELIEGEPVLNASPSGPHQRILGNLIYLLGAIERQVPRSWIAIPGIGVRVSDIDLPEPDVLVRSSSPPIGDPSSRECDDMIIGFEILSPSTKARDLRWKRLAYMSLPSLTHYVVVAQDAVEVVVFGRDARCPELRLNDLTDQVELPALGIVLSLAEIYRGTGLDSE